MGSYTLNIIYTCLGIVRHEIGMLSRPTSRYYVSVVDGHPTGRWRWRLWRARGSVLCTLPRVIKYIIGHVETQAVASTQINMSIFYVYYNLLHIRSKNSTSTLLKQLHDKEQRRLLGLQQSVPVSSSAWFWTMCHCIVYCAVPPH